MFKWLDRLFAWHEERCDKCRAGRVPAKRKLDWTCEKCGQEHGQLQRPDYRMGSAYKSKDDMLEAQCGVCGYTMRRRPLDYVAPAGALSEPNTKYSGVG